MQLLIHEHEPAEMSALLATDEIDLALTYDYDLAPIAFDATVEATRLWSVAWSLGAPQRPQPHVAGNALAVFQRFRDHGWIVNSRNTADEDVVRTVASMAGFEPRIVHRADSLELVEDVILAGGGVALMPADRVTSPGIDLLPLTEPDVRLRSYAVTRRGQADWPLLALVLKLLTTGR